MTPEYQAFLAAKAPKARSFGFDPMPVPDHLFDFQQAAVEFCIRQGRAALFYDTGMGKTVCELEFARQAGEKSNGVTLLLTPLAVARQIEREGLRFGYNCRVVRDQSEVLPGINICNYDRMDKLDASAFGGVVLDECFAKGTKIDTPTGKKHIENLRPGDYILNCTGVDRVSDVHQREVPYAVLVKIAGASFVSSPNHPIFTQRGWVGAQHLRAGDHALATGAAVRLVRDGVLPKISIPVRAKILREIMLSEMADDAEGCFGAGAFSGGGSEAWEEESSMVCFGCPGGSSGIGEDNQPQSNIQTRSSGQDFGRIESHEARTIRAWGQWSWDDVAASVDDGCSWTRLDSGISVITGPKEARIPDMLQARLRQSEYEGRNRGGWNVALGAEDCDGSEARYDDPFIRVDGIEILEPRDNRLDELRDADGKLYFYDLGATRHPSYSVNGFLVHNSSILKSFSGATTRALIAQFADTPYRLAASATPAPNDHTELGNHAEFLGIMPMADMLIRWFINDSADTGTWRLKGHAVTQFWDWVSSWAVMASSPDDLGFDGSRFVLPPMDIIRHKVSAEIAPNDGLFGFDVSATDMFALKRQTAEVRADEVARLVASEPDEPWLIWVDTDYEADAVVSRIKHAIDVRGSMSPEKKEEGLLAFLTTGRPLVTKSRIAGQGLNYQHCARQAFVGRSFSYEAWYQAVRRSWRFGQTREVHVHLIVAEGEDQIGRVIDRKSDDHEAMREHMRAAARRSVGVSSAVKVPYNPTYEGRLPQWLKSAA